MRAAAEGKVGGVRPLYVETVGLQCRAGSCPAARSEHVIACPACTSFPSTSNRGLKPSPSSGKNRVGSRSLSAAHDPKLVAFPVYTSVGPSNVSRIFPSTVAPTNAFPWREPDAIHRRYLETSPRHCPERSGRGAPVTLRRQGSRPPHLDR
jgi:hypothetical protein